MDMIHHHDFIMSKIYANGMTDVVPLPSFFSLLNFQQLKVAVNAAVVYLLTFC